MPTSAARCLHFHVIFNVTLAVVFIGLTSASARSCSGCFRR
jgi:Na+/phosphate symporter